MRRIKQLMKHDTAGDPMTGLKWTRRTTDKIAVELEALGIEVSPRTVARLLKQMGFSLRVNQKSISGTTPENRDAQFTYIEELREQHAGASSPIISVDTKKKELVGNFKNGGAAWSQEPTRVNDHDFRSDASGLAVPYGVYDIQANRGTVFVGTSYDTPKFAVTCLEKWWRTEGQKRYPGASSLLILADCGGSNGYRCRAWKYGIQNDLCDRHGLTVTVAHYPAGASKWNPIEHKLFSQISKNWAAVPLLGFNTILKYLRTTTTSTGLRVRAHLDRRTYKKGVRISDSDMKELELACHDQIPAWNYVLSPRT